jgi:hypothetical protein
MVSKSGVFVMVLLVLSLGCAEKDKNKPVQESAVDSGAYENPVCAGLDLPTRAFDATLPAVYQRHQPAGDFTVTLRDGSLWTLSSQWTGCESYVFAPHWFSVDDLDDESWWTTGVDELIARSPRNVHYFFVVAGRERDPESIAVAMETEINEALAGLSAEDAAWWGERIHLLANTSNEQPGLVDEMFDSDVGTMGFAVDREQKIRSLGYFPAVEAFDNTLNNNGLWPWELELYSLAHEAEYFNFLIERQARLDSQNATIVPVFDGSVVEMYTDGTLTLPDAATMAAFDSLEVEVVMECPNKDKMEINNCGAWDYLANFWLQQEDGSYLEIGRFITTYHRESHWVVDGSHALSWLKNGGSYNVRYSWAPEWNVQPTGVTLNVRLFNQNKGSRPQESIPLFEGGSFSSTYNDRDALEIPIPADAKKVELAAIITGHGMETRNCAEFCDTEHHFTVNSTTHSYELTDPGLDDGCAQSVVTGTVPNQAGTWWYGRNGWCPGREVAPYLVDITSDVTPGSTATISYQATQGGSDPIDGLGTIEMRSWLVVSY